MKTAEQFLQECKERWKETDPRMSGEAGAKRAMIEALILYAEQAVDKCAESAKVGAGIDRTVDKASILSVNDLLK